MSSTAHLDVSQEGLPRIAHFCDKTGQGDLSNEGVADVEESSHAIDKSRVVKREDVVLDRTRGGLVGRVRVEVSGIALNADENGGQEDGDEGEESRRRTQLGHHAEGAGERGEPADYGDDNGELNGSAAANAVRGSHGVDVFGTDENVQSLDKGVVEDKHDSGEPPHKHTQPRHRLESEQGLANVADIAHFRMAQTKLPQDQTGVEHERSHDNSENQTWDETENGV